MHNNVAHFKKKTKLMFQKSKTNTSGFEPGTSGSVTDLATYCTNDSLMQVPAINYWYYPLLADCRLNVLAFRSEIHRSKHS